MNDTSEALNWIMTALSNNKMGSGKPPLMKIEDDEAERQKVVHAEEQRFNDLKNQKNGLVHTNSRRSPYMKTSRINRFPVPNVKLYWEVYPTVVTSNYMLLLLKYSILSNTGN